MSLLKLVYAQFFTQTSTPNKYPQTTSTPNKYTQTTSSPSDDTLHAFLQKPILKVESKVNAKGIISQYYHPNYDTKIADDDVLRQLTHFWYLRCYDCFDHQGCIPLTKFLLLAELLKTTNYCFLVWYIQVEYMCFMTIFFQKNICITYIYVFFLFNI